MLLVTLASPGTIMSRKTVANLSKSVRVDKVFFPAILLCIAGHILQISAQSCPNTTQVDLCFVIDGSGSICDTDPTFNYDTDNTCNNWASVVNFVYRFVSDLNIGPNDVRVAVVIFDSTARLKWNLTSYLDKNRLLDAINMTLEYRKGGSTDTTGGLNVMATQVFNTSADRPKALRTAIIITDGKPTTPSTVPSAVSRVHSLNITTFVIGITDLVDESTLRQLSSPPQQLGVTYFMVSDYSTIDTVRYLVLNETCLRPTTATSSTTSTTTTTTPTTTISNPITRTTIRPTTPAKTTDSSSTPRDGCPVLEIGLGIGVPCGFIIIVLVIITIVLCVEIRSLRKFKKEIENNNQSHTNGQQVANGTVQYSLNHYQQLNMQNPQRQYERIDRYDTNSTTGTETTGHYETPIN